MSKRKNGRGRPATIVMGGAATIAGAVLLTLASASAQGAPPGIPGTRLAPIQLPQSAGFTQLGGFTQIISGRTPLWTAKDGTGPYPENSVGFAASLQQGFVISAAIKRFGTLNHGLALPLPLTFASAHPGPAEVFDIVWSFRHAIAARELLYNPRYNNDAHGTIALSTGAVHGGRLWQIVSQANGGMDEYLFKFVRGSHLIQVSVIGARLSLPAARVIAVQAGSGRP